MLATDWKLISFANYQFLIIINVRNGFETKQLNVIIYFLKILFVSNGIETKYLFLIINF